MSRQSDNLPVYVGLAGAVFLFSPWGATTRDSIVKAFKAAVPPAAGTTPPAAGTTPPAAGATPPAAAPISRPDTPTYKAWRARLPTTTLNEQIWVQRSTDGRWVYVASPSEFASYGIQPNMANVTDIPWGSQRGFTVFGGNVAYPASEWVRSDTATGVFGGYPQVPADITQALKDSYSAGKLVPVGPVGYALLKQQGAL